MGPGTWGRARPSSYVTTGKLALLESAGGITDYKQLRLGGRIVVQNDVVSTFPDDDAIANYDGAVCLVPFFHCLIAKRPCPCEERSSRFLGRLYDGAKVGACRRSAPYLADWLKKQRRTRVS